MDSNLNTQRKTTSIQEKRIAAFIAAGFDPDSARAMVENASAIMHDKGLVHDSVMVELVSEWHLMEQEIEEVGRVIAMVSGF